MQAKKHKIFEIKDKNTVKQKTETRENIAK